MNIPRGVVRPIEHSTHNAGKDIDLVEIALAIWRGRSLIFMLCLCGVVLGGLYGLLIAKPKYAATTTLVLQQRSEPVNDLGIVRSGVSTELTSLNTELSVIRSRGLIEQLVDDLDLIEDAEFNPIRPASIFSSARWLSGRDRPAKTGVANKDLVVRNVQSAISVRNQRNTFLFDISVTSQDQSKAVLMANTLARLYIDRQAHTKFSAVEDAVQWLSERVSTLEQELMMREGAVATMRAKMDLKSVEALDSKNTQLKDTRARLETVSQKASDATSILLALQNNKEAGDFLAFAKLSGDAEMNRLLTAKAPAGSDVLIEARAGELASVVRNEVNRLTSQKLALARSVEELQDAVQLQAADLAQLQQLEREAQATKVLYETFLTRMKETSVLRGLQQADSQILSNAVTGIYVSPQKTLIALMSLLIGLAVGVIYVLVRQFLYTGFRNAADLEMATGRPVFGQIPKISIAKRAELLPSLVNNPTAATVEAIRNLRTSLLTSNVDDLPQVILSASSVPGEGKTTQAIAIAHCMAGLEKRVLLIEGDMRRRTFSNSFPVDQGRGIASVLSGDMTLADAVQHVPDLGADVLLGEVSKSSAADLFASPKFGALMTNARENYDIIIVDSPPALVVPDARILAHHADAIMYSVAWDKTTRRQVAEGLKQFDTVNTPIAGMVLSQIEPNGMARYGYGGTNPAYTQFGGEYYGRV